MPELIIFGLPPSSYVRTALMVCAAKGVEHRLEPVDFRSPAYRSTHPFGRMPAMQHGELRLFETLAIASYVDEAFDGPALQPGTPAERAMMLQWISVTNDYLYEYIVRRCVQERFVKPMRGLEPDEAAIAAALPVIESSLDTLDAALVTKRHFCGDQLTLADLFAAPVLAYFAATPEGKATLPQRENLSNWLENMRSVPGFEQINRMGP